MFIVLRPSGRDHDSQNQYYLSFGDTKTFQIIGEETRSINLFRKSPVFSKIGIFVGADRGPFDKFGKILNMISISIKKHEMGTYKIATEFRSKSLNQPASTEVSSYYMLEPTCDFATP